MLLMVCRHAEKCKYCNGPVMKIPLVNIISSRYYEIEDFKVHFECYEDFQKKLIRTKFPQSHIIRGVSRCVHVYYVYFFII